MSNAVPQADFDDDLLRALNRKMLADLELLRLEKDVRFGKRPFSAAEFQTALSTCDSAAERAWSAVQKIAQDKSSERNAQITQPAHAPL